MRYFDHNATAPLLPEAQAAWIEASGQFWYNPGALHRGGVRAALALAKARATVADLCKRPTESVIFNGGATEAANGIVAAFVRNHPNADIFISAVEHPCIERSVRLYAHPRRVHTLPVTRTGTLDVPAALQAFSRCPGPGLVALMAANNETGALQPCEHVFNAARNLGLSTLCDASQWPGRLPLDALPQADWVFFGAHKCGGPKGVGVILQSAHLDPAWAHNAGGGQENGMRSGTENLPAIIALTATLQTVAKPQPAAPEGSAFFLQRLRAHFPDILVFAESAPRLWNTVFLALPDFPATRWVARLQAKGFYVGTGAGCSAQSLQPSSVLLAMGFDASEAGRSLRLSSGMQTASPDWSELAEAIVTVYQELS